MKRKNIPSKVNVHLRYLLMVQVLIDPACVYQTIEGFGASDCWTANYVGQYWHEKEKEQIVQYLFSREVAADGSPKGIGLSMWRFNLGAGTSGQGAQSQLTDISRRAECFIDASGNYNWSKQAGQQWFLNAAKAYGCHHITAFSNSPPVFYTRNGKGYADGDGYANLPADKYTAFAAYMATVAEHFHEAGLPFKYISPVNEPQWDWKDPTQEGSPWHNEEISRLAVELDKALTAKNLPTQILLAEAGEWDCLYADKGRASNQISQFFDSISNNYVGSLSTVAPVIAAHSYWTHDTNYRLRHIRENVRNTAAGYGLTVFQTEWSMLDSGEGFPTVEDASPMDIALLMAKVIHGDMVFADAAAWYYWTAMDMERWGHKNRFLLLALAPDGYPYQPITLTGTVSDRPTLWALGNYSYFVRPGYKRIELTGADELSGFMGSAYLSDDQTTIVAVFVNLTYSTQTTTIQFNNITPTVDVTQRMYVTNSLYNLRQMAHLPTYYTPDGLITIPSRSVATVTFDLGTTANVHAATVRQLKVYPNPVHQAETLFIELPGGDTNSGCDVKIYNLTGQLLIRTTLQPSDNGILSLPTAQLEGGTYLFSVSAKGELFTGKFSVYQ